jgi:hypothetical protein
VEERLLKAMREARPRTVRELFALANRHRRWEFSDLARRFDEQPAAAPSDPARPGPRGGGQPEPGPNRPARRRARPQPSTRMTPAGGRDGDMMNRHRIRSRPISVRSRGSSGDRGCENRRTQIRSESGPAHPGGRDAVPLLRACRHAKGRRSRGLNISRAPQDVQYPSRRPDVSPSAESRRACRRVDRSDLRSIDFDVVGPNRPTRLSIRIRQAKGFHKHHDIDSSAYRQDLPLRLSSQPADQLEERLADAGLTSHPWARRSMATRGADRAVKPEVAGPGSIGGRPLPPHQQARRPARGAGLHATRCYCPPEFILTASVHAASRPADS